MIDSLKHGATLKGNMMLFGSTIGQTQYPLFLLNNKVKILPRPVVTCRYGNRLLNVYKLQLFKELIQIDESNMRSFIHNNMRYDARFH